MDIEKLNLMAAALDLIGGIATQGGKDDIDDDKDHQE